MTDFLTDLEAQLRDAHPRRRAARRRARAARALAGAPMAALVALVLAGGAAAIVVLGEDESARTPALAPIPATEPPAEATIPDSIAVLNGTTRSGFARAVADQLPRRSVATVTNASTQDVARSRVEYVPGDRSAGVAVLTALGLDPSRLLPVSRDTQVLAPEADVVVVVGLDFRLPLQRTLVNPLGAPRGRMDVLRNGGVALRLVGAVGQPGPYAVWAAGGPSPTGADAQVLVAVLEGRERLEGTVALTGDALSARRIEIRRVTDRGRPDPGATVVLRGDLP